jgi:6-pyruvoyltetrahydropterin/6-carboxytetrahydropterin synthase
VLWGKFNPLMPYQITRKHEIHCGHRVCGHEGKCRNLHGHAYVIHFTCEAEGLDPLGRVIEFGVIKSHLCQWLEDNWDHRMLIWAQDHMLDELRTIDPSVVAVPFNPTAENIAAHLVTRVAPDLLAGTPVRLVRVQVDETSKCSAAYYV